MYLNETETPSARSVVDNTWSRASVVIFKRIIDVFGAVAILLAIAPIMLIVAAVIYVRDPGPVFFSHPRIGKNGKSFGCLKFRSMVCDAADRLEKVLDNDPEARAEWKLRHKLTDDPRILPVIGNFLRSTSIDELPQLFNVLRGEMSLIGPRPCTQEELDHHYGAYASYYKLVRPGISGFWQVSGRSDTTFAQRVQMDVHYVRHMNLGLDLWITARTPIAVLSRNGAC